MLLVIMKQENIKVLFVAHSTGFGGASRSMLQLMIELRNNYNVTPIVLMPYSFNQNDKYSMKFMCNQNSIEVIETFVPWFKRSSFVKFCILYLLHSLYLPVTMWKLRHYKFDLIHSNGSVQSLGGLLSGYDTGVISGALLFINDSWNLSDSMQGIVVSSVLIGAVIGAATNGVLADIFGRKKIIMATAVIFIVGSILCGFAPNFYEVLEREIHICHSLFL